MKKRYCILIALILPLSPCFAQTNFSSQIIPPSPITKEYNKYISYNISLYNGLPDISVPLYEITLKGLTIPISLSYHASGIKSKQEDGDVGVGWTFNPGYRISRTIMGRADERRPMPVNLFDSISYYSNENHKRDRYLSKFIWDGVSTLGGPSPYFYGANDLLDGEYDLFNYSLPSANGSFIISDRTKRTITPLEQNNFLFEYSIGNSGLSSLAGSILSFNVYDENGNEYLVGEHSKNSFLIETNSQYGGYVATGWGLEKIKTPFGENVDFKYSKGTVGGWRSDIMNLYISETLSCLSSVGENADDAHSSWTDGTDNSYTTFFVDEIVSEKETIKIFRNTGTNTINEIQIFSWENVLVKTIKFYYSRNKYHNFLDSLIIGNRQSKANEVFKFDYYDKIINPDVKLLSDQWGYYLPVSALEPSYLLHEEFKDDPILVKSSSQVPRILDELDGTYNFGSRETVNEINPEIFSLHTITYPSGGITTFEYESHKYQDSKNFSKKIGGIRIKSIKFDDLINPDILAKEYFYGDNQNGTGKVSFLIDHKFFVDESIFIEWTGSTSAKCRPVRRINYSTNVQGDLQASGALSTIIQYPFVTEVFSSKLKSSNGKIEYKYKIGEKFFTNSYYNHKLLPCHPSYQYLLLHPTLFISRSLPWNQPLLQEKKTYIFENNRYILIENERLEYTSSFSSYSGLKVRPFSSMSNYTPVLSGLYSPYEVVNSFFRYGEYVITSGYNVLSSKKVSRLSQGGMEHNSVFYFYYNLKNQLSKTRTFTSEGIIEREFVYPSDFNDLGANNSIRKLKDKNILNVIIEERESRLNNDLLGKRTVSAKFIDYNTILPLPNKIFIFETHSPSDNFVPVKVTGNIIQKDSRYSLMESFNQYDKNGNVLSYNKKDDLNTSYIWDYNSHYPTARVVNAEYTEIAYTSFETSGNGNWEGINQKNIINSSTSLTGDKYYQLQYLSKTGLSASKSYLVTYWSKSGPMSVTGTQSGWPKLLNSKSISNTKWNLYEHLISGVSGTIIKGSGFIDELRLYPTNALMTTFSYRPLIGLICQTDENNATIYYEYDALGRLTLTRDQDNNIIKKICYNYAGQPEDCPGTVVYLNDAKSQSFSRNNCPSAQNGSTVTYTIPKGKYTSTVSLADANAKAQNDINLNGQAFANANGTCLAPSVYAVIELELYLEPGYTTADVYMRFYKDKTRTARTSVSNLTIFYNSVKTLCRGGAYTTNYSKVANGTQMYLGNYVIDRDDGLHCDYTRFNVLPGNGYIPQ